MIFTAYLLYEEAMLVRLYRIDMLSEIEIYQVFLPSLVIKLVEGVVPLSIEC